MTFRRLNNDAGRISIHYEERILKIIRRPSEKLFVTSKWIYKIKHIIDGCIYKYEYIFLARYFCQKEDIYYEYPLDGCEDFISEWYH